MTTRRAFTLGLLSGGVCFTFTLYWLVETMTTFGGLQPAVAVFAAGRRALLADSLGAVAPRLAQLPPPPTPSPPPPAPGRRSGSGTPPGSRPAPSAHAG